MCFSSKAVHLELVSDLSTAACIAAIRRFVSRRGCPKNLYSDNGKNFVGSEKEIADLQKISRNEHCDSLQAVAAGLHIKWFFIRPRAPDFGGLWESAIKYAKIHLRKVMGNKVLSFEEICTLLCQIEMILNSRPICPLSEDPNDEFFLTRAHFCLGGKLENLPLSQTTNDLKNPDSTHSPTKRWIQIQKMVSHFWKRWVKEYVLSLQERNKWRLETSNLKVGDIVFVFDDNVPPLQWPLASAKTTTSFSLNDCLLVGPKLHDDLFNILVRFRFFKIALSADVAKMYRQVELDKAHRDFHRILWRFTADGPVETLRMTRFTYGVASSSYHSIRSLRECANLSEVSTEVQRAILRDFHVDDILTGANSIDEARILQKQLVETLKRGRFDLRKWNPARSLRF